MQRTAESNSELFFQQPAGGGLRIARFISREALEKSQSKINEISPLFPPRLCAMCMDVLVPRA
jgi:hypothetical protein